MTVHRSVLRNEEKNNGENKHNETGQTARSQKYSGPKEPGSSNVAGLEVS